MHFARLSAFVVDCQTSPLDTSHAMLFLVGHFLAISAFAPVEVFLFLQQVLKWSQALLWA
jgi:hypothetical protein